VDDVGWSVVAIVILIFPATFFSIISFAIGRFSWVKIQEAFKSLKKEKLIESFLADTEKLFWAGSFFAAVFSVCITVLLFRVFLKLSDDEISWKAFVMTLVAGSFLFSIFQIIVPYTWAKYAGEFILARTYNFLRLLSYIVFPLLGLLGIHDLIVRRLAGIADTTADQLQEEKQEEFLSVVEQGKMEGVVDAEEQEMIEHVLELNDTTAEKIMTPRTDIVAIRADSDIDAVLETIKAQGHSRIPVYQDNIDHITGLVYAKDLLGQIGSEPADFSLDNLLRDAYFVPETKSLRELLHEFQEQKLHIAIVLDEYGGTAGIVTIEDIIEEVVGEIVDEYEQSPPESMHKLDQQTVEVDARMHIDDLNSELDVELPEDEDYDTIGGFVFSYLGYIPKAGQTFEYKNLRFCVANAERRRINRLKIQKISDSE